MCIYDLFATARGRELEVLVLLGAVREGPAPLALGLVVAWEGREADYTSMSRSQSEQHKSEVVRVKLNI